MTRLPQPPEVVKLKNSARKHPERYRKKVPKSDLPLGHYPEDRATDPAGCWFELSSMCIPGVMTRSDRVMLEIASNLLAEYREEPVKFTSAKLKDLISCLARFGMSPSDRNKLGVDKPDPKDNPFAALDD